MGTNFYLFTKNKEMALKYAPYSYELTDDPEFGYEVHIAKISCGWLPLFQAHKEGIRSVKEYKMAYNTGEFKILDEYGDEYDWNGFDERVLQHEGGKLGVKKAEKFPDMTEKQKKLFGNCVDKDMPKWGPVSHIAGSKQSYGYSMWSDKNSFYADENSSYYADEDGYEFDERWFR